ncbi:MAG: hypothetical protein H7177_09815 [Rhizobacter sp.]|nr:hypothetical protein [Bacteriovorax sp.]
MKIKLDASWINNLSDDTPVGTHPFFFEYTGPSEIKNISRNGLYLNSWNYLKKEKDLENQIFHEANSLLFPYMSDSKFFRFKSDLEHKKTKKILFIFYIDPETSSIAGLENALINFKKNVEHQGLELFSYIGTLSSFSGIEKIDYINSFYEKISMHLGQIPKKLNLWELQRMSSMNEWMVYEAGSSWICTDNYLVHLALSKGAKYIPFWRSEKFQVEAEYRLSRHHSIEMGTLPVVNNQSFFSLYQDFVAVERERQFSEELGIPHAFISAIYRDLGTDL